MNGPITTNEELPIPEGRVRPDYSKDVSPRVICVTSSEARAYADLLPSNKGRSSIVHSLIESLDLLGDDLTSDVEVELEEGEQLPTQPSNKARVVEVVPATRSDLCRFHDKGYINALFEAAANLVESPETSFDSDYVHASPKKRMRLDHALDTTLEASLIDGVNVGNGDPDESIIDHGLEHDCPVFQGLEDYCSHIAGGSITAARELRQGRADIAIFWDGGRHHATKSAAAGFCYINDIVLSILELQKNPLPERSYAFTSPSSSAPSTNRPLKRLKKILYVDLDLHHGDGVAEAFESNPNVVTVSLHLWSKGFYPSTPKGHLDYTGPSPPSRASNTTLNIAVPKSGLSDTNLNRLVEGCIIPVFRAVNPDAVVLQCGVDGLAGDPCKEFNVSLKGYGSAVGSILSLCGHVPTYSQSSMAKEGEGDEEGEGAESQELKKIPVLVLGGGGYHHTNAARAWAYLTSIALGRPLNIDVATVPEHCPHWEKFYNDGGSGEGLDVPATLSRKDENEEGDIEKITERFREHADALASSQHLKK